MREEEVGKRVGIWIRVSPRSVDQRKGQDAKSESPELHQKRAELYAEMKGWEIAGVYRLIDVSGKDVAHHPETRRMLSDVRRGAITGLIFSKLARLGRKTDVLIQILDTFREHDADLISLDESIDTSTPAGRNFFRFMASNAEWEREEIAERMQKSIEIRAKLGKQISGAAPFGYRWEKGVLVVDPAEAPVRKLIYELYLKHKRKGTVARLLNQAGHRTRSGGPFHALAVERLILDPTSKGIHRRNYTTRAKDNKATLLKPESEWEMVEVEPIVSEDVWEEAVALLNANRQPQKVKRGRPAVQIFGGLVFCAKCNEKMYVKSNNPKYICPKCGNKIPKGDLEFVFREQLHAFALSPEQVSAHLADADAKTAERTQLLEQITREEAQLARQMDKTYRLYLDEQLSAESFGKLYRPLEERAAQLAEEIPRLQAEVDFARMQHLSRAELVAEGESLYARWETLEPGEKRSIVEAITERIEVNGDEIEIRLCYLPPPKREELAKNIQSPPARTVTMRRFVGAADVVSAASGGIAHRTGTVRTEDGVDLFWQAWVPPGVRANVLLSHGLGEHGGRYARLAEDLGARGIAVWAPDHRGHGRSPGTRGHVPRFQRFADDFEAFRRHVAAEMRADVPLFLYGHSLGGLIALRHLQTHPHEHYRGAILSAPLLGFHARGARWKTALAGVLTRILPGVPLANEIDPGELSHDAAYVATYRTDPLVHPYITPRLYTEMVAAIETTLAAGAALTLPLLFVLPGADPIVRTDATQAFARGLAGDVTVRVYEGMYHEAHNETERARVVADVAGWMASHGA